MRRFFMGRRLIGRRFFIGRGIGIIVIFIILAMFLLLR